MNVAEKRALYYSAGMHVALLVLIIFGLPDFFDFMRKPEPVVYSVTIKTVSKNPNVKPVDAPPQPPIRTSQPKTPPEKPVPITKKTAPAETAPEVPEKPKPPTPETPKDTVSPVKAPVKEPEKPKPPKPPKPPRTVKNPPKQSKPPVDKPDDKDELDAILEDVKNQAKKSDKTEDTPVKEDKPAQESGAISDRFDESQPLSNSEMGAVIGQIKQNWNVLAGAKDDYTLVVTLRLVIAPDGKVLKVTLEKDQARRQTDSAFAAAVLRAMSAVRLSSPLKGLPPEKYDTWKDMVLDFDPRNMLY